jgi:outer membrane receptor protein involved in Fe transport
MAKFALLGATALRSAVVAGFAFSATGALAQSTTETAPAGTAAVDPTTTPGPSEQEIESGTNATAGEEIVVTGSRIRRPNLVSTIPVTSVGGEEFFETGTVSVGDALNDLPALRSTLGQANSTQFLGTGGLNLLDLRGLGTQRTLVLVNGRRHVAGDVLFNANSPDVNTIPTDLIERVDVVTGGNSAIYGSDALAGVVNFVLKQDYQGIQVRGQSGISKYGDAGAYYASILAGKNFADGRGNVAVNVEYARQNDFYGSARPNLRRTNGFVSVDTDPASAVDGSDGVADSRFFNDIRSSTYTNAGTFLGFTGGSPFPFTPYVFGPDGTLAPQTGTRVGRGNFGSFIGGNGDNFRDGRQLALSPALDRYSFNLIGHFEVSKAFVPFVEAKYSRTDSSGSASGPFFTGATGSPRERFNINNPFLAGQAANLIRGIYGDYYSDLNGDGVNEYDGGPNGINDADEFGFTITKNVNDLGQREEKARRETYRVVAGVRGDFGSNFNYELSANYGQHRERTDIFGNVNVQRYLLAIDAVRNPAGQIVCRSQINPTAAVAYETAVDKAFAASQLAADVAACVPLNLFGSGNITPAARNYIISNSQANAKLTQLDLTGFVSGNTASFFNLPGGPVGFAVGGEYRREKAFYDQDNFTQTGLSFYNAIPTWRSPAFEVKEAFGELRFPILKNVPFFNELTLSVAGRVSDYKGSTGTVYSYNAGLDYAPVRDVRFRGNYSRAVRAPNLSDTSFPLSQNFDFVDDPCSSATAGSTPLRQANCAAAGVPAGFDFEYDSTIGYLSGGNPNLREEYSDSFTVGTVIQPRFLPGFSASVDYYDITVNKVITSLSAQSVVDSCYDQATINNQFCGQFSRFLGTGRGPNGEVPGQILEGSLRVVPLNFAKLKVRGIDAEIAYRRDLGSIGKFTSRLIYTHALENASFLNPLDPKRGDTANGELGSPKDAANLKLNLEKSGINFGYEMRYLGKMTNGEYENYFSYQGRPPENADAFEYRFYPETFYHDARIAIDATKRFNFYVGVDNIFNTNPPLGLTGIGDGSGIYTNRGRFFYAGVVAKF